MTRSLRPALVLLALLVSLLAGLPRGAIASAQVLPIVGAARTLRGTVASGQASFVVESDHVPIRYGWTPDAMGGGLLSAARDGDGAAPIAARYRPTWAAPAQLIASSMTSDKGAVSMIQLFDVGGRRTTLRLHAHIANGTLVLDLAADQPLLTHWSATVQPNADTRRFSLPYSPVDVFRSGAGHIFAALFLDWTASDATAIVGNDAVYRPRTDGALNRARERLIFSASPRITDVMPNAVWPRSRYYDRMTGRIVIDVTVTETFADIERKLIGLREAGLSNCIFLVHVWQRMGYDNGLPATLPANDFLGGQETLKRIGGIARDAGCAFALHQNYIDDYPDSGVFDPALVARDAQGELLKAWFNRGFAAQSYSARPRAFVVLARPIAPLIHQLLGTSAAFVDVNSSFQPWQRVDMDAQEPDGGRFRPFLDGSKALFSLIQDTEQGPVLGEGGQHAFYWTGALDGVEANSGEGAHIDQRLAPLWVDFALRKIHPLQQNYGMGFYERYMPGHFALNQADQDIYRTQQIAFGHLPYRSGLDWGDPRRFVQEAALAGPVAQDYGGVAVAEIAYRLGERWVPLETALPVNAGRTVRVRYANGLVIILNTGAAPVNAAGIVLPGGGWSAHGPAIMGSSGVSGGKRRDFMRTADAIYADPREAPGNWAVSGADAASVDFGILRTSGQVWMRCEKGTWTFIGFAQRGFVDVAVKAATIAMPTRLIAAGMPTVLPVAGGGFWRARLASGRRYASQDRCTTS